MNDVDLNAVVDSIEKTIAASAQQFEPKLAALVKQLMDPGNGKVIQIPGQRHFEVQGPKERHVLAAIAESLGLLLQGQRLTMLAVRAIVKELPEADRQESAQPGKVERGSQSPGPAQHSASCSTANGCQCWARSQGSKSPRTAVSQDVTRRWVHVDCPIQHESEKESDECMARLEATQDDHSLSCSTRARGECNCKATA